MLRNAFAALCTETTLLALKTVADAMESVVSSIHTKVAAIQVASESTNSKIIACNTGDVWVSNLPDVQAVSGPLTDAELRLHDVQVSLGGEDVIVGNWPSVQNISGFVEIANDSGNPIPITGSLTNTELRAADIKVTLDGEHVTLANPGLTDTQLRVSDVKVSLDGEQIVIANFPATQPISGTVAVSNPGLTDAQLRASAVHVSVSDVSTETTLSVLKSVADNILAASQAIKTAVEAFNTKTTVMNTEAVFVENDFAENSVLQAVRDMTDTLNAQLQQLVNVLAPVKARGAALLVEFSASQSVYTNSTIVTNTTAFNAPSTSDLLSRYRIHEPWNNSDMGATRLYDQIKIS